MVDNGNDFSEFSPSLSKPALFPWTSMAFTGYVGVVGTEEQHPERIAHNHLIVFKFDENGIKQSANRPMIISHEVMDVRFHVNAHVNCTLLSFLLHSI